MRYLKLTTFIYHQFQTDIFYELLNIFLKYNLILFINQTLVKFGNCLKILILNSENHIHTVRHTVNGNK